MTAKFNATTIANQMATELQGHEDGRYDVLVKYAKKWNLDTNEQRANAVLEKLYPGDAKENKIKANRSNGRKFFAICNNYEEMMAAIDSYAPPQGITLPKRSNLIRQIATLTKDLGRVPNASEIGVKVKKIHDDSVKREAARVAAQSKAENQKLIEKVKGLKDKGWQGCDDVLSALEAMTPPPKADKELNQPKPVESVQEPQPISPETNNEPVQEQTNPAVDPVAVLMEQVQQMNASMQQLLSTRK